VEVQAEDGQRAYDIIKWLRAAIAWLPHSGALDPIDIQSYEEFAGPGNLPREDAPYRYTMTLSIGLGAQIV
jgi:hypothetical protein